MEEEINREDFVTPFGRVLGVFQGVEGRSNGSDRYFSGLMSFVDGFYTGYKYQCVEYARRWLLSKGLEFHSVPFASHIWHIKFLECISDGRATLIKAIDNGSTTPPAAESIIIWKVTSEVPFGHIAIITEVSLEHGYVRIAEQNVDNNYWPGNYARELKLEVEDGKYYIRDEDELYGWMVVTFDIDSIDQATFERFNHPIKKSLVDNQGNQWLDLENPIDIGFSRVWGEKYDSVMPVYEVQSFLANKIKYAALESTFLCARATAIAIKDDGLLRKLELPEWSWPLIKKSWENYWEGDGKAITGKVRLGIKGRSVKFLGYTDTFEGLSEAAYFNQKLSEKYKSSEESQLSSDLYATLLDHCGESITEFVHIFIEEEASTEYQALFVQKLLKDKNIESKIIKGLAFRKVAVGEFQDLEGRSIKCIWKFWDWEKIFADYERVRADENELKISDLMLSPEIKVFEPIWKVVISNRGLLPIIHENFSNHQYALDSSWELTESLVSKPHKVSVVGSTKEGTNKFYIEDFHGDEFEGKQFVVHAWPARRKLGGFSIAEPDSGLPFACTKISEDV